MYAVSDPRTSYLKDAESKAPPIQVSLFIIGALALVVALVMLFRMNAALRKLKLKR
jgi:hypothetical protein